MVGQIASYIQSLLIYLIEDNISHIVCMYTVHFMPSLLDFTCPLTLEKRCVSYYSILYREEMCVILFHIV